MRAWCIAGVMLVGGRRGASAGSACDGGMVAADRVLLVNLVLPASYLLMLACTSWYALLLQALPRLKSASVRRVAGPRGRCATCAFVRIQPSTCSTWTPTQVRRRGMAWRGTCVEQGTGAVWAWLCIQLSPAGQGQQGNVAGSQFDCATFQTSLVCLHRSLLRPQIALNARGPQPREGPQPEDVLWRQLCAPEW